MPCSSARGVACLCFAAILCLHVVLDYPVSQPLYLAVLRTKMCVLQCTWIQCRRALRSLLLWCSNFTQQTSVCALFSCIYLCVFWIKEYLLYVSRLLNDQFCEFWSDVLCFFDPLALHLLCPVDAQVCLPYSPQFLVLCSPGLADLFVEKMHLNGGRPMALDLV